MNKGKICMLMILDGWGINPKDRGNAVRMAGTPFLDKLFDDFPNTRLVCSGKAVGLPAGIMGNSEVGHLNIGAGRTVYQDLLKIDMAIDDGSFFKNDTLGSVMEKVLKKNSALHLMGLLSNGGVHSQISHLFALLDMARQKGLKRVYVHPIMDGRDTPPDSGAGFLENLVDYTEKNKTGEIATICGRYYAMDRDNRWDRVEKAYKLYAKGEGTTQSDPVGAVKNAYKKNETDEFIKPIVITDENNQPRGVFKDDDGVIFFNFRADRAREITRAFNEPGFDSFSVEARPALAGFACMTIYDESFTLPIAFPPVHMKDILGSVVSRAGISQLRIAETEKYAHVTYFFNGGEEKPFPGEDRCLVPSPREVETYDEKPEMSAHLVAREVISRIKSEKYGLIVLNFANMDMVGHTGIIEAAIKAVESVDSCVKQIIPEILSRDGSVLITADHGNAEKMISDKGTPFTSHTLNPVPLILVNDKLKDSILKPGTLGDLAPTIIKLMGLQKPEAMTGESLISA